MPTEAQLVGHVGKLKARIARLEYQKDWAEREQAITHRWAEEAWEEVRHLRDLLDKALSGTHPAHFDGRGDGDD